MPPPPISEPRSLWRHRDFRLLWAAQTVSLAGSSITAIALPLTAILTLDASARQLGFLGAAGGLPALLFSLLIGVWVDRLRRRPLLVAADLGRALLLGLIPLAVWLDALRLELLYAVAFATGMLTLLFDIAVTSFLPAAVGRARLLEGNSKLQLSVSVTSVAGPSVGGTLVQLVTAPLAIAADALSFLLSALFLWRVRAPEPPMVRLAGRESVKRELVVGLRFLLSHPLLRASMVASTVGSLALSIQGTVLLLFATATLGIEPALLGIIFAIQGGTALIGALLAGRIGRRIGTGPAVIVGSLLVSLGLLTFPFAGGPLPLAVSILMLGQALVGLGTPLYAVGQVSLRQLVTPDELLGRVNAGRRTLVFGVIPLGALLGGTLGETVGLRPTLLIGALCSAAAVLVAWRSPLRTGVADVSVHG